MLDLSSKPVDSVQLSKLFYRSFVRNQLPANMPQVIHLGPSKKYYDSTSSSSSDSSSSSSSDSSLSDYAHKHRHHGKSASRHHKHRGSPAKKVVVTEAIIDKHGNRVDVAKTGKKTKGHVSAKTRLEHPHSLKGLLAASAQTRIADTFKIAGIDYVTYLLEGLVRHGAKDRHFQKPTFELKELGKDLIAGIGGDLGVRAPGVIKERKHGRPEHKRHRHRHTHRF
jgi:hypothetical protein